MNNRIKPYLRIFSLAVLTVAIFLGISKEASAQVGTASAALSGIVRDASGAVIPGAAIALTNVDTGTNQTASSNSTGTYSIIDIPPGHYTVTAQKQGFNTAKQPSFTLEVNQTATINFRLQVGSSNTTVLVSAAGTRIETATAELGMVIGRREINDLPLNGRNFTELLLLGPGISTANPSQNAGGGGIGNPIGNVTFPAINGQSNRSNMFLLDGINNYGSIRDTYAVQPIIDDMLEFKVQSHNDEAQFGQTLGGIVNLVTKSGTNQFHGDVWEFLRNDALDATNYFNPVRTPLNQNQFGANIGGPVLLPYYNGRNKTFFFGSYEGFRNDTSSENLFLTPTPAQLSGNFGNLENQGVQLFNPYSSVPNPTYASGYFVQPFMCDASGVNPLPVNSLGVQAPGIPCDILPPNLLNQTMVYYAKSLFPAPINTGNPAFNGRDTTPITIRQNEFSARIDEQIGDNDRIFVRYTRAWQPDQSSGGFPGLLSTTDSNNYNAAVNWTHTFGNNAVLQLTFGRVSAVFNMFPSFTDAPSNFLQQAGFASYFVNHPGIGAPLIPTVSVNGYLGGSNFVGLLHYSDIWEYKGDFTKVVGRHTLKAGASMATDGWTQPYYGSNESFGAAQTADGNGNGGDALAAMVLGIPNNAGVANIYSELHGGKVSGVYFQDQWRISDKLTVNLGLRYDLTTNPREGIASNASDITGDFDFNNGTYILQDPAPACSATQGAPCIPGGVLPPHVTIAKNGKIIHDQYNNIQPRLGFAYQVTPNTVVRGGYGRFYDNWAGVTQNQSNFTQTWPNIAAIGTSNNLNIGYPTAFATDPFNLGNTGVIEPFSSPFSAANVTNYTDPDLKNPYADEWNFGVERQLSTRATLTINYVGSRTEDEQNALTANAAPTPGPGNPQLRAPYPYILPQPYTENIGTASYNALQVSAQIQSSHGLTGTFAYTRSKAIDEGCGGIFNFCDVQNPYDIAADRSVAGTDQPNIFVASFLYMLPFGQGGIWRSSNGVVNVLIGGWQINGIVSASNGSPYDVQTNDPNIANTNNLYGAERADIVGNPHANTSNINPINTTAFAIPAPFTFGNMPRNSLRFPWNKNVDFSVFRSFSLPGAKRLEFRGEAFNALNQVIFGGPDNGIEDPNFGVVSSTANTERQLQVAVKFYF
ncbi:MAG: TonB-dependent receptor [Acidobacteriaceae bacterium]